MKVISDRDLRREDLEGVILTLGNFDGVHLGHQEILKRVVKEALLEGTQSMVFTFKPHPLKVIAPERRLYLITTEEEKEELMEALGVDILCFARFTEAFAQKHPEDFVREVIIERIGPRRLIVGYDYSFGKGRMGGIELLERMGREAGFQVEVIPPFKVGDRIVSSSLIRELILKGEVREASSYLGRPYSVRGKVVKGAGRGRFLGFPTANLIPSKELLPARGVYATLVYFNGKTHKGVANVGYGPTFNTPSEPRIEVYIFDLRGDLYGKEITVHFIDRIREERAFESPSHLIKQIEEDIGKAKEILYGDKG